MSGFVVVTEEEEELEEEYEEEEEEEDEVNLSLSAEEEEETTKGEMSQAEGITYDTRSEAGSAVSEFTDSNAGWLYTWRGLVATLNTSCQSAFTLVMA